MSFVAEFERLQMSALRNLAQAEDVPAVRELVAKSQLTLNDFAQLIAPGSGRFLEALCQRSQSITRQRFGKVIRLFAPLYLSNECINNCKYCGFSRDNAILRVTLSVED